MNRRSFLRGLLALPIVGVAVKHSPHVQSRLAGTQFPVGTIHRYSPSSSTYSEITSIGWIRTGR